MSSTTSSPRGFTLIELLTVIAIIGILAAIIIPTVSKVRTSASRAQSISNMRQIVAATLIYVSDNKDALPHRADVTSWNAPSYPATGNPYVSGKLMAPYIPWISPIWFDPLTSKAKDRPGKIAANPGYAVWLARVFYNQRVTADWPFPGLSVPVRLSTISRPSNALLYYNGDPDGWAGYHDGYGTVGFADGSARRIWDGSSSEKLIVKTYVAVPSGQPFPGYLE